MIDTGPYTILPSLTSHALRADRSTHALAAAEHGTLDTLAAVRVTGALVVTGAALVVTGGVVVVVGATVVVGSTVDLAGALVAVSAATAICGDADELDVPDEHAAMAATAITADSPTTILLMRTSTPSPNRRRSATVLDVPVWLLLI
jgi:hypothetical protein